MKHWRRRFDGLIFWWTLCLLLCAVAVLVARQTRLYEATGVLEIPRPKLPMVGNHEVVDAWIRSEYEINTVLEVVASKAMISWVFDRLTVEERSVFFRLHGITDHSAEPFQRLIQANRTLSLDKVTFEIRMSYRHPDRHMASRIVDLFLKEGVAFDARVKTNEATAARQYLEQRAEHARQRVQVCEQAAFAYLQSRLTISGGEQEAKETYESLIRKTEIEANLHKQILARLSDMHAADKSAVNGWRISQAPITPGEDDYLLAPLLVTAAGGLAIAIITGVLAALLFKRRTIPSNQSEAL